MADTNVQNQEEQAIQGQPATIEQVTTVTIPTLDQLKTMSKEDLQKLKTDVAEFPDAIEQVIAEKVKEEEDAAKNDINKAETKVQTWSEKFREKHGVSVWVALIGGGYIVWQVGAAVARVLGAM